MAARVMWVTGKSRRPSDLIERGNLLPKAHYSSRYWRRTRPRRETITDSFTRPRLSTTVRLAAP